MRLEACRRRRLMWRLNAWRRDLVGRGRNRDHRAAMAMLAPERSLIGGVRSIVGGDRDGLRSRLSGAKLSGAKRSVVLSQVDETDRQKCHSGNKRDGSAKRRSEKIARNQLIGGRGHIGK
jgi:hypothetical protein